MFGHINRYFSYQMCKLYCNKFILLASSDYIFLFQLNSFLVEIFASIVGGFIVSLIIEQPALALHKKLLPQIDKNNIDLKKKEWNMCIKYTDVSFYTMFIYLPRQLVNLSEDCSCTYWMRYNIAVFNDEKIAKKS